MDIIDILNVCSGYIFLIFRNLCYKILNCPYLRTYSSCKNCYSNFSQSKYEYYWKSRFPAVGNNIRFYFYSNCIIQLWPIISPYFLLSWSVIFLPIAEHENFYMVASSAFFFWNFGLLLTRALVKANSNQFQKIQAKLNVGSATFPNRMIWHLAHYLTRMLENHTSSQ